MLEKIDKAFKLSPTHKTQTENRSDSNWIRAKSFLHKPIKDFFWSHLLLLEKAHYICDNYNILHPKNLRHA